MDYNSIRISIICFVDDNQIPEDGYTQDIQVHICRRQRFRKSFKKAIEKVKYEKHDYTNELGGNVKWVFKAIEGNNKTCYACSRS